jgi:hypothetical protein
MARHASRAAYAIDVSACFPALIVGPIFAVADAQSDGLSILLHPGTGDAYARPYRPRRLVGQRAAATGERSAKVAEDAVTFLKICAVLRSKYVARMSEAKSGLRSLPSIPQDRAKFARARKSFAQGSNRVHHDGVGAHARGSSTRSVRHRPRAEARKTKTTTSRTLVQPCGPLERSLRRTSAYATKIAKEHS